MVSRAAAGLGDEPTRITVFVAYTPTPLPPVQYCATVGDQAGSLSRCSWYSQADAQAQAEQAYLAERGGNIGIVGTPSPLPENRDIVISH
jgi:hypothetical protein